MSGLKFGEVTDVKLEALERLRSVEGITTVHTWTIPLSGEWFGNGEAKVDINVPMGETLSSGMVSAVMEVLRVTRDQLRLREKRKPAASRLIDRTKPKPAVTETHASD
jgi:hypothetical protein